MEGELLLSLWSRDVSAACLVLRFLNDCILRFSGMRDLEFVAVEDGDGRDPEPTLSSSPSSSSAIVSSGRTSSWSTCGDESLSWDCECVPLGFAAEREGCFAEDG